MWPFLAFYNTSAAPLQGTSGLNMAELVKFHIAKNGSRIFDTVN